MTKLKDEVPSLESKKTSRRKFFKAAAATGAVAAAVTWRCQIFRLRKVQ